MAESPLAALVSKASVDDAMDALREAGVYDERRSVRERDDGRVTIPITDRPASAAVTDLLDDVIAQSDPVYREGGLPERLLERGWTEAEVDSAPSSWATVGTVILVDDDSLAAAARPEEVADALLDIHGDADTVVARDRIDGEHREPSIRVVAGAGDTETVHTEHGTQYALDLAEVMFSPGNKRERARMGEIAADGESVLDMFAGIGYFALPMARAGAEVIAVERNPASFRYLLENARLNGVGDRLRPFRADCADVAPEQSVERVVMGYFDAVEYLDPALDALDPEGTLHLHAAVDESALWDEPVGAIEDAAAKRDRTVEVLGRHVVKGCGAGFEHVVIDARVE